MGKVQEPAKSLWTPGGEIRIREKDVVPLTREEIGCLIGLDAFSRKHGVTVECHSCGKSLVGQNNGHETYFSVTCECREYRYVRTGST